MPIETGTSRRKVWHEPNAVQLIVKLDGIEPEIWRHLVVPISFNLANLHALIQAAFGWKDCHLHEFIIGGLRYGDSDLLNEDWSGHGPRAFDASAIRLADFVIHPRSLPTFKYVYDFGDQWRHTVEVAKLLALEPAPLNASCVEGARCCPPEDVGGPHGYFEFLRVLLSPEPDEIEEQRHLKRWSGGKFNPERFDVAKTDKAVRGALRRKPRG